MNGTLESDLDGQKILAGLTAKYDATVGAVKNANERALEFIGRRPIVSLIGAAAFGYIVARMARR